MLGVAAVIALLTSAILIGLAVSDGVSHDFDEAFLLALRVPGHPTTPIGPGWLSETARDLTALGGVADLTILTTLVTIHFLLRRELATALVVAGSAITGTMISNWLKAAFERPRPELTAISDYGVGSFPSGHSTASAVVYLTLGLILAKVADRWPMRVFYITSALLLTGLVGLSRLYLGVHYPTDVAAGWSIGAAWALICALVASALERRMDKV
jgi:undecaprenyl-diphosphatase